MLYSIGLCDAGKINTKIERLRNGSPRDAIEKKSLP